MFGIGPGGSLGRRATTHSLTARASVKKGSVASAVTPRY